MKVAESPLSAFLVTQTWLHVASNHHALPSDVGHAIQERSFLAGAEGRNSVLLKLIRDALQEIS